MPFESEAQRRFLYANEPGLAKEFAAKTPKHTKLPERKKKAMERVIDGGQKED